MLFKFASYLLGTNTEQEDPHSAASPTSGPSLTNNISDDSLNLSNQASRPTTVDANSDSNVGPKTDQSISSNVSSSGLDANAELIYDECVVQTEDRPERLEDSLHEDDEQWIYITPIRVAKEQEKRDDEPSTSQSDSSSQLDADEAAETEQFNMMDLFAGNQAHHHQHQHHLANKRNKLEESWVIHPPACFQVDNTFAIEQHPMENLYIEQPALSVMNASAGTNDDKENKKSVTHHHNNHSNHQSNNYKKRKSNSKRSNVRDNARKNRRLRMSKLNEPSSSTSSQVQDNSNDDNNRTSVNTDSTSVRAVLNTGSDDNGANRRRNSLRVKLTALESSNSLSAYSGFRRENLLTRPFTIHRKLC